MLFKDFKFFKKIKKNFIKYLVEILFIQICNYWSSFSQVFYVVFTCPKILNIYFRNLLFFVKEDKLNKCSRQSWAYFIWKINTYDSCSIYNFTNGVIYKQSIIPKERICRIFKKTSHWISWNSLDCEGCSRISILQA